MSIAKAYGVYLMEGTGTGTLTYAKLVDIVDMPDIEDDPDELEITTLSDGQHRYMPGILGNSGKDFTINYDKTEYAALKAKEGQELHLAIWMGFSGDFGSEVPDGHDGKWSFDGYISVRKNSQSVGDVPQATVHVTPSSVVTFA